MNDLITIVFFFIVFSLMIAGREFERYDSYEIYYQEWLKRAEARHNGLTDRKNYELQDSLWKEIQKINQDESYNRKNYEWIRYEGGDLNIEIGDSIYIK